MLRGGMYSLRLAAMAICVKMNTNAVWNFGNKPRTILQSRWHFIQVEDFPFVVQSSFRGRISGPLQCGAMN
jgi:hypothetical protein